MTKTKKKNAPESDLWLEFVESSVLLCSLCGNSGVIDTRTTAISGAGVNAGRLNWCICPNGRALKKQTGKATPCR